VKVTKNIIKKSLSYRTNVTIQSLDGASVNICYTLCTYFCLEGTVVQRRFEEFNEVGWGGGSRFYQFCGPARHYH